MGSQLDETFCSVDDLPQRHVLSHQVERGLGQVLKRQARSIHVLLDPIDGLQEEKLIRSGDRFHRMLETVDHAAEPRD
jgi:hypothetical protein